MERWNTMISKKLAEAIEYENDGEKVMTMTMYTDLSADGISFECDGKAVVNITKSDM